MEKTNNILQKSFLPKKAFDLFREAEIVYKQEGALPSYILEALHSYFDESFEQATELLEKSRITRYSTANSLRDIYEISTKKEQYTIQENINFCRCDYFSGKVLESLSALSCKHVLAVHLAIAMDKVRKEELADDIFEDYLNIQLDALIGFDTQAFSSALKD